MPSNPFPKSQNFNDMKKIISLFCLMSIASAVFAQDVAQQFKDAAKLYTDANYDEALKKFKAIEASGYQSGELFFNIGNASYKTGQLGNAILYYEKATRLLPDDEDVRHNLDVAHIRTKDKIQEVPKFFLSSAFHKAIDFFSQTAALILFFVMLYAVTAVATLQIGRRWTGVLSTTVLTVCLVGLGTFAIVIGAKVYDAETKQEAIILNDRVDVRSEPKDKSDALFVIHEGLKVEVQREENDWTEIKLADGNKGWIPKTTLGKI
jgi:tetratricopeptide (TPR) repeat protein